MPLDDSPKAVRETIVRAFAGVEHPTGRDLAPHDCDECEDVRERLAPRSFEAVPDEDLDWLRDSLPLLGPKGLNYYLPAYLLRVLREPEWDGTEYVMYHLSPTRESLAKEPEYWRSRLGIFSLQQREAVLAFFSWLQLSTVGWQYDPEIAAAREIWSQAA
jgi:hypothetical protein